MRLHAVLSLVILAGSLTPAMSLAQPEQPAKVPDPAPAAPTAPADNQPATRPAEEAPKVPVEPRVDAQGRRIDPGDPTKLSFKGVTVEALIPFIAEATGKVILPQQEVLARTITVISDKPVSRQRALDLVFLALQQREVTVIETDDIILLRTQSDVHRNPVPVVPGDVSLLARTDYGSIVCKVFALKHATAVNVGEVIKADIPDYAKMATDAESNQVVITGPVIILQRLEKVITQLDRPQAATPSSETFHLKYSDAELIKQNILDLYSSTTGNAGGQRQPGGQQGGQRGPGQQGGQRPGGAQSAATSAQLKVTANAQQNAVTVVAEPEVLASIRRVIIEEWDKPPTQSSEPKVYDLKYTDPVKMKAVLEGVFGTSTTTGQGANARSAGPLAGQFFFQAVPEANRLLVISKSPENISIIDKTIEQLDQPMSSGLPEIIELKHANADDLAEQINALLAREQTLASVRRSSTTLSTSQAGASPFATNATTTPAATDASNAANTMTFWWTRSPVPTDNAGASNLVGRVRIVPVGRQNALMVLATPEYKKAVIDIIGMLDRPGRQVLIRAIVVELTNDDALALGARFSNTVINPTRGENSFGTNANSNLTGTKNNVLDTLFDTSVLNLGVNINVLLQALGQQTQVRILSEPKIFTGDNQEAEFFDGQDIPFISTSQPNTQGNIVQTFDYKAVGIVLRVRPRITPERDIDLKVNLQLSSITPGNTLFGGAVVDRRETTTQLIIGDGQTMVISGIMRSEDSEIKRKVPIIGDIPVLGWPFTSIEKTKTTTELVAFITPIVVNNKLESEKISKAPSDQLNRMRKDMNVPDSLPAGMPPVDPTAPVSAPAPMP